MTTAIKAVIFDFGGVFTTSPVENFALYEKRNGLPDGFVGGVIKSRLHDGAFSRFERGEISFEEFDRAFASETREAGAEIDGSDFIKLLDVAPKPEMIEAFRRIKRAGLKTGCITNNFPAAPTAAEELPAGGQIALSELFSEFDCVLESSKIGIRKPEPRIYEMMLEKLGLPAAACIFIDDLGVNLKPARAMGMTTIRAPFGDIRPAIDEMAAVLELALI